MCDTLPELKRLIAIYRQQLTAWRATAEPHADLDADVEEYDALDVTSQAILRLACTTADAARAKVTAVLEIEGLYTIVKEDLDEEGKGDMLRTFLATLFPTLGDVCTRN